ncbi:succinate dehydrogenase assembly factor 2 [Marinomonas sp. IMCC 4694]|uniref:FAD assembly factor SdhE n=1 Tax=Marinomonas sp. IMCC 4694 TaxID=2605432 RepID=UPI0011E89E51|nr:succinate dehydrogenase assembly factor 2 [Marinomonas sp. IMCC 4694]TYL48601.1 succinate dehydrogenase assembly factor 2 [Marinomonas sp. IMCC 4694]
MLETSESLSFKRLKWQCRRGMLELDVLLEPFLDEVYLTLEEEDKQRFHKLIECEDQDLFPWFMQKDVPEDENLARIVNIIVSRVQPQIDRT